MNPRSIVRLLAVFIGLLFFSALALSRAQVLGEVSALRWCESRKDCLEWSAVSGADRYFVRRGEDSGFRCLFSADTDSCRRIVTATQTGAGVIPENPAQGRFFWFLVTAGNSPGAEGPAGNATHAPRQADGTSNCSAPCVESGGSCAGSSDCCSDLCVGGTCQPRLCCFGAGAWCQDSTDCCSWPSGFCDSGHCCADVYQPCYPPNDYCCPRQVCALSPGAPFPWCCIPDGEEGGPWCYGCCSGYCQGGDVPSMCLPQPSL